MQIGYSCVRKALVAVPKQVMVAAGLLILPLTARLEKGAAPKPPLPTKTPQPQPVKAEADPRTDRLKNFFTRLHCPVVNLAPDFIEAADENELDWRLLPSISVIESGGGKAYRNNNIFGWDNGLRPFTSIRSGIREVAYKLGRSPLYKDRDVEGKLRIYNPDENYARTVVTVMRRISPVARMKPVRQIIAPRHRFALENNS